MEHNGCGPLCGRCYRYSVQHDAYAAAQARIDQLETELAEARRDSARLNELEAVVSGQKGGLLLHHQLAATVKWDGTGLGLSHRSLRKAIDDMNVALPAMKEPHA
jgi:CRISPR/Cas system-associated exonuclease Cas4 (RecB family)